MPCPWARHPIIYFCLSLSHATARKRDMQIRKALERINIPAAILIGLVILYALNALNSYWIYRSAYAFVPVVAMPLFLIGVAAVAFLLRHKIRVSDTLVFVLVLTSLGLFYMAVFPPFMVPDSFFHYRSSYMYSNILMGLRAADNIDIPMRICDIEFCNAFLGAGLDLNREHYMLLRDSSFWIPADCSISVFEQSSLHQFDEQFGTTTAATFPYMDANPFQLRIVSALGMTLGRILGLGALPVFYLGEMFNLSLYVCLVGYAVHVMPKGKRVMMAISLLPMTLHLAASYSYDVAIIGFAFLLIAVIVKAVADNDPIATREMVLISILVILIAPCKFVYVGLSALVLLIPKKKFSNNWKAIGFKTLVIALALLSLILFRLPTIMQMVDLYLPDTTASVQTEQAGTTKTLGGDIAGEPNDTEKNIDLDNQPENAPMTFGYAINHPGRFVSLVFSTFDLMFDEYIGTAIGSRLAWLDTRLQAPWWFIMLYIGILVASMLPCRKDDGLSYKQRAAFLGIGALITLLILISFTFSMTSINDIIIVGLQGRYLLPILPLLLMAIAPKNAIKAEIDLTNTILFSSAMLSMMHLSHIFSIVMAQ